MPSDNSVPNIFRTRNRFSPLKEIEWRAEYNLGKSFLKELESSKTNIEASLDKELWLRACDLHCAFIDIALIISRINEDGTKVNRREELHEIAHGRMWTDEEEKEFESFSYAINYLVLDVKTLIININIFMDVLAKFLVLFIKKSEKLPESKNFPRFKKHLKNYKGREIDELKKIIYENTEWFDDIKDLRDDFVIHHPAGRHALEFFDGIAHIPLTTTKKEYNRGHIIDGAIAKSISLEKIDSTLSQLKELLKELNKYLYEKINTLPFEAEYFEQ